MRVYIVFVHDENQCPKCVLADPKKQTLKNDRFQVPQRKTFCGIEVGKGAEIQPL